MKQLTHSNDLAIFVRSVVEDSAPNRKLLCALLGRLQCAATAVENGLEAVRQFLPDFQLSSVDVNSSLKSVIVSRTETSDYSGMDGTLHTSSSVHSRLTLDSTTGDRLPAISTQQQYDIILMVSTETFAIEPCMCHTYVSYSLFCVSLSSSYVLVQDNSMPIMTGVTATLILRQHGIQVPIVGVTGNTLEEDQMTFLAAGANEILVSSRKIGAEYKCDVSSALSTYTSL
jgi:CheY-like chemotaxis protein